MNTPIFPREPAVRYAKEDLDTLLLWTCEIGSSDIVLRSDEPVWARVAGRWERVTRRTLTTNELSEICNITGRSSSYSAQVLSGSDQDYAYEIKTGRVERMRFRVNATACRSGFETGISITLRTIPSIPPSFDDLKIEESLRAAMIPIYGLVLVTGPVGSGKTTTLAATMHNILTTQKRHVITYEDPIEFDLFGIPGRIGLIEQTQMGAHLKSRDGHDPFILAPRNSLRRAGDVVLFGESRDKETLRAMMIEAETGVAVYSTVHTNSVSETVSRIVKEFPYEERESTAVALVSCLRCVVHQRLVKNPNGGRTALREYLEFSPEVRDHLVEIPFSRMTQAIDRLVDTKGQSLLSDMENKHRQGLVLSEDFHAYKQIIDKKTLKAG